MTNQKQIRYLCLRVFVAQGDEEYQIRLAELRSALRKPVRGVKNLGIFLVMKPKPNIVGAPESAERKGMASPSRKIKKAKAAAHIQ